MRLSIARQIQNCASVQQTDGGGFLGLELDFLPYGYECVHFLVGDDVRGVVIVHFLRGLRRWVNSLAISQSSDPPCVESFLSPLRWGSWIVSRVIQYNR